MVKKLMSDENLRFLKNVSFKITFEPSAVEKTKD